MLMMTRKFNAMAMLLDGVTEVLPPLEGKPCNINIFHLLILWVKTFYESGGNILLSHHTAMSSQFLFSFINGESLEIFIKIKDIDRMSLTVCDL